MILFCVDKLNEIFRKFYSPELKSSDTILSPDSNEKRIFFSADPSKNFIRCFMDTRNKECLLLVCGGMESISIEYIQNKEGPVCYHIRSSDNFITLKRTLSDTAIDRRLAEFYAHTRRAEFCQKLDSIEYEINEHNKRGNRSIFNSIFSLTDYEDDILGAITKDEKYRGIKAALLFMTAWLDKNVPLHPNQVRFLNYIKKQNKAFNTPQREEHGSDLLLIRLSLSKNDQSMKSEISEKFKADYNQFLEKFNDDFVFLA